MSSRDRVVLDGGVGAADTNLDFRMNASAVGLLSIRVATAAARVHGGGYVNDRDRQATSTVASDLRQEAKILRGESSPSIADETAYAVADATLTALSQREDDEPSAQTLSDDTLARRLDDLATELEALAGGSLEGESAGRLEVLFLSVGGLVSQNLGQHGEYVEGVPEVAE